MRRCSAAARQRYNRRPKEVAISVIEEGSEFPELDSSEARLAREGERLLAAVVGSLTPLLPEVLSGRYVLADTLGRGSHGQVLRAQDRLTGEAVAIKLLDRFATRHLLRLRAEIAALRMLMLPGVARLFDEGEDAGFPYLVFEIVPGTPFPGGRRTWEDLRSTLVALLETLARVHAVGIVHRDLKPANVLVDEAGRPTVLDFGLAIQQAAESPGAESGMLVGTPAYAAPEQLQGEPVDARSDLYAVGCMVFEALAGHRPHPGGNVDELLTARLQQPAPRLNSVAPDVPAHVAELVDRLLERDPGKRPRSAVDVLSALRGGSPTATAGSPLPLLGREHVLGAIATAAASGRCVEIVGAPGSGRTRCLREATARLQAAGRRVFSAARATSAFQSLVVLADALPDDEPADYATAQRWFTEALERRLATGEVLCIDDVEDLDRWSAAVVCGACAAGTVLMTCTTAAALASRSELAGPRAASATPPVSVTLEPLTQHDLRALCGGPDRLLHLREDAAAELWMRTLGHPSRLEAEVSAWIRAGLAQRVGDELIVQRQGLERLKAGVDVLPPTSSLSTRIEEDLDEVLAWISLAWPNTQRELLARIAERPRWQLEAELAALVASGAVGELPDGRVRALRVARRLELQTLDGASRREAHARIAAALPAASTGRLYHLLAAGRAAELIPEACAAARAMSDAGRLGAAEAVLRDASQATRGQGTAADRHELFRLWIDVAFADPSPLARDRLLHELVRVQPRDAVLVRMERLVEAAAATYQADGDKALRMLDALTPFVETGLELWRQALRVRAARRASPSLEESVLAEARCWAAGQQGAEVEASCAEWEGLSCYGRSRFVEAAHWHARAALHYTRLPSRLSARLNEASSRLEALQLDEVMQLAGSVCAEARECRHALFEGRAEWLLRAARYRSREALVPDLELVDVMQRAGLPEQAALVCLNEAAVAWRARQPALAAELAQRAEKYWHGSGFTAGRLLARSLALLCGKQELDGERAWCLAEALRSPLPQMAAQALALLALGGEDPSADWQPVLTRLNSVRPVASPELRWEVLSWSEVRAACTSQDDGGGEVTTL